MTVWPPSDTPPPPPDPPRQPASGWWLASDGRYYPPEQAPGRPVWSASPPIQCYGGPSVGPQQTNGPSNGICNEERFLPDPDC